MIAPRIDLSGLWIPIVTPFARDGSLDEGSLDRLARRLLADGADGLVALGTTGEPSTLTLGERRRVVDICAAVCETEERGLLVGAGTNSTATTIQEIHDLTSGTVACAALIVVPYYTRPSPAAVVEHFQLVANESRLPLVLYNIPYRTGVGLAATELLAAGRHPNVVGLKQATGSLDIETLKLLAAPEESFQVLAGDDAFIAPTMLLGGTGAIAAAAHLCTPLFTEMVTHASAGHAHEAAQLAALLLPVVTAGFAEPNPAVWKGALAARGEIESAHVRRPLTAASEPAIEHLLQACEHLAR